MMADRYRSLIEYIHAADLPIVLDILDIGKFEPGVRQACLKILGNLGDESMLPVFLKILQDTSDFLVLEIVLNMREQHKISAKALVRFLKDAHKLKIPSVRDRVVEELFRMAWDNAVKEDGDEDLDHSE